LSFQELISFLATYSFGLLSDATMWSIPLLHINHNNNNSCMIYITMSVAEWGVETFSIMWETLLLLVCLGHHSYNHRCKKKWKE
jgi:hypothetical protein